jgi:hypothetical protein
MSPEEDSTRNQVGQTAGSSIRRLITS